MAMPQDPGCPRCAAPVARTGPDGGWACPEHGEVPPLWRADEARYERLAEHLRGTVGFPTYLPWPLSPGWAVTDLASAGVPSLTRATLTGCTGTSPVDGPVDLLVVTEEPGTGLGSRVAGTRHVDPGAEVGHGPSTVSVRVGSQTVRLWPVSTQDASGEWDRSVLVGEAQGRWLWLVLRPASAALLLRRGWILRDVSAVGPPLLEVPFAGPRPPW